jgi:heme/copper-type cytochrome/quinol oxidase subunit 3
MTVTDTNATPEEPIFAIGDHHGEGDHHDAPHFTPAERHRMEHIATWMFIGGDFVFFILEIFSWFYLRALNTNGMWRGTLCSPTNQCAAGGSTGFMLTHPVEKADPLWTFLVAGIVIVAAAFVWFAEAQARSGATRKTTSPMLALGMLFTLGAIAVQLYQFQILPFQTTFGAYASVFMFYMGANVAHFAITLVMTLGIWNRSRLGKYEGGSWYQLHLVRLWIVWVAVSSAILAIVSVAFA